MPETENPAPPAAAPILELNQVAVTARRDPATPVIGQIDWCVRPGEFWVIGGMHGSGKSDFMAMLAGLSRPHRGSYRLFGGEMSGTTGEELLAGRRRLGLVFDNGGRIFNHLTVAENIALPARYHQQMPPEEITARVQALLDATELGSWAHQTPGGISRNWRQRVGLARALALQPEILLLDNPLAGLDPRHVRWWMDFVARLAAGDALTGGRPVTLIATTDDLRPWRKAGRQFATLHDGSWHTIGPMPAVGNDTTPMLRELLVTETGE